MADPLWAADQIARIRSLASMVGKRPLPKPGLLATTSMVRGDRACQLFVE